VESIIDTRNIASLVLYATLALLAIFTKVSGREENM
jgi:hypothetical protein